LVSKIGDKLSVLMFTLFIYIGVVISFLGLWTENYSLLVIGRVIFGLGGENLISAQMVCAEKWFKGKYLAVAMGLNMVFCYVGSLLNNFFTPFIESRTDNMFHTSVIVLVI
jgi:MFS family permease